MISSVNVIRWIKKIKLYYCICGALINSCQPFLFIPLSLFLPYVCSTHFILFCCSPTRSCRVTQLGSSTPTASHTGAILQERNRATDVYLHQYCHKPVAGSELSHTHTQCLYRRTRRLANEVYTIYIYLYGVDATVKNAM